MNTKEIRQLRKKFIMIAMLSFIIVMLFICIAINLTSTAVTNASLNSALETIYSRKDEIFEGTYIYDPGHYVPSIADAFSADRHQNRFFMYEYDSGQNMTRSFSNVKSNLENSYAEKSALDLLKGLRSRGRSGMFYFRRYTGSDGTTTVILLNCSTEISLIMLIMIATAFTFVAATIISFILVYVLSGRMIQPEIENSIRQKEFITNASHELKTPLAVIRANTECTELVSGETEWTRSTLAQVDHMNGLIQNLVMIARASEKEDKSHLTSINASKAVEETVAPYDALALQSGKELVREIEPDAELVMDESKFRQLCTILIDNAIKYCDDGGRITVSLQKEKKGILLTVSNSYKDGENVDYKHFFDRFYREDKSHNIDRGGYGIGLSIAESITSQSGGSIKAAWKDGVISFICRLM